MPTQQNRESLLKVLLKLGTEGPMGAVMQATGVRQPSVTPLQVLASLVPQGVTPMPQQGGLLARLMWAAQQPGVLPIGGTVYHGTPHKFAPTPRNPLGEFDLSKVGTGEGSQAYGHGIYLAETESVAKSYRPRGKTSVRTTYKAFDPELSTSVDERAAGALLTKYQGDIGKARSHALGFGPEGAGIVAKIDELSKGKISYRPQGRLYHVDLPDEQIARMLDWDAPLSQQPENVRRAVASVWPQAKFSGWGADAERLRVEAPDHLTGAQIYARLSGQGKDAMSGSSGGVGTIEAAARLRSAGIPGIKYLDRGSRTAGKGTRNFVLFDPSIATITGVE